MKRAAVIIVNWNGKQFLADCLGSLAAQSYLDMVVYLVDNGSTDGSVEFVQANYPTVKLIPLDHNTGFSRGNNVGIRAALTDRQVEYIITLNNDTKVDRTFVQELVLAADREASVGAVAPKIKFFYEHDLIDSVGLLIHADGGGVNRGNKEPDRGQYDQSEEIFGVCAGAALYKRAAIEQVMYQDEVFDEIFFAYYEDLDLAWRLRLAGWRSVAAPCALVYHVHSATAVSYSPFKAFHVNRNRFFVILKDFPFWFMVKALLLTPMRYIRLINSMRIKKGPSHKLREKTSLMSPFLIVIQGWGSVLKNLPQILRKRRHIQRNKVVSDEFIQNCFEKYCASIDKMIYQ